jgi:hypothetical protein
MQIYMHTYTLYTHTSPYIYTYIYIYMYITVDCHNTSYFFFFYFFILFYFFCIIFTFLSPSRGLTFFSYLLHLCTRISIFIYIYSTCVLDVKLTASPPFPFRVNDAPRYATSSTAYLTNCIYVARDRTTYVHTKGSLAVAVVEKEHESAVQCTI